MSTFRVFARVSGIIFLCVGLICLPIGFGDNAKRDTSLFFNLADLGGYIQDAMILIPAGILVILLSYRLPSD